MEPGNAEAVMDEELGGAPPPISPCPPHRPQEIHDIVETVDRYNPENLPLLQMYVEQQLEHDIYDHDACFAVLKLYQFNDGITDVSVVCDILTLTLATQPEPNFNLAVYLLDPEVCAHPQVQQLIQLQRCIEEANYLSFWEMLKQDPVELPAKYRSFGTIAGEDEMDEEERRRRRPTSISPRKTTIERYPMFVEKMRRYISSSLSMVYQSCPLSFLASRLGFIGKPEYELASSQLATAKAITDAQVLRRMADCEETIAKFILVVPHETTDANVQLTNTSNTTPKVFPIWIKLAGTPLELDPQFVSKELELTIASLKLGDNNQQTLQQLQQETVKFESLARIIASSKKIKA